MLGKYSLNGFLSVLTYFEQCRVSFKSTQNQDVLRKLIKEVKGQNPSFESSVIRGEIKRYLKFWYFIVIIFRGCIPLLQDEE